MGKGLRRNGAPGLQGRHLGVQLLDAGDPGAGDGLIGADDHTTNGTDPVQSGDGRDGDDGGTIGVGDDAAVVGCVFGVDLRNHQRDVGVQAKRAGVVDKYGAGGANGRGKALGDLIFCCAEDQVHAPECAFLGLLNGKGLPAVGLHFSGASGAGQQLELSHRKISLLQDAFHLLAHGAGGA